MDAITSKLWLKKNGSRVLMFPLLLFVLLLNLQVTAALNIDSPLGSNGGLNEDPKFHPHTVSSEFVNLLLKVRDQLAAAVKEKVDIIQAKDEIIKFKDAIISENEKSINELSKSKDEAFSLLLSELNEKVDLQAALQSIIQDRMHHSPILTKFLSSLTTLFKDKRNEHFSLDLTDKEIISIHSPLDVEEVERVEDKEIKIEEEKVESEEEQEKIKTSREMTDVIKGENKYIEGDIERGKLNGEEVEDGKHAKRKLSLAAWTLQTLNAQWSGREAHTSVAVGNNIVTMGGAASATALNDVWLSVNDGVSWTKQTSAAWGANGGRWSHTSVVFDNNIVTMGGYSGEDNAFKDVWLSVDSGVSWTLQTLNAQWSGRYGHTSVVVGVSYIVTMGGFHFGSAGTNSLLNDVWLSVNRGVSWTLQTLNAQWSVRRYHTSVVVGNSIVNIGGFGGSAWSDVNDCWSSDDRGISWTLKAQWNDRDSHTSVVVGNNIVSMGGRNATGVPFNDVWLTCPAGYFAVSTSCKLCSSPVEGFYVTSICLFSDTVTAPCANATNPPSGSFVFSLCTQGGPNALGSQFLIKDCSKASAGQFVIQNCVQGSSTSVGSDTILGNSPSYTLYYVIGGLGFFIIVVIIILLVRRRKMMAINNSSNEVYRRFSKTDSKMVDEAN